MLRNVMKKSKIEISKFKLFLYKYEVFKNISRVSE